MDEIIRRNHGYHYGSIAEKAKTNSEIEIERIYSNFSESYIIENADLLNWKFISHYSTVFSFSDTFFEKFKDQLNWDYLSFRTDLNEKTILNHFELLVRPTSEMILNAGVYRIKISEPTLEKILSKFNFSLDSYLTFNSLTENFIRKHIEKIININTILNKCNLSISFFEEYEERIDFTIVSSTYRFLTKEFLEKFHSNLEWNSILSNYVMSENLLKKYETFILKSYIDQKKRDYNNYVNKNEY